MTGINPKFHVTPAFLVKDTCCPGAKLETKASHLISAQFSLTFWQSIKNPSQFFISDIKSRWLSGTWEQQIPIWSTLGSKKPCRFIPVSNRKADMKQPKNRRIEAETSPGLQAPIHPDLSNAQPTGYKNRFLGATSSARPSAPTAEGRPGRWLQSHEVSVSLICYFRFSSLDVSATAPVFFRSNHGLRRKMTKRVPLATCLKATTFNGQMLRNPPVSNLSFNLSWKTWKNQLILIHQKAVTDILSINNIRLPKDEMTPSSGPMLAARGLWAAALGPLNGVKKWGSTSPAWLRKCQQVIQLEYARNNPKS